MSNFENPPLWGRIIKPENHALKASPTRFYAHF